MNIYQRDIYEEFRIKKTRAFLDFRREKKPELFELGFRTDNDPSGPKK